MSVYKPKKGRYWQYDFVIQGRRFYGSTGQVSKRKAEDVERQRRYDAALGQLDSVAKMTLDDACGRWWREKGIHRGDAPDVERRLGVVLDLIGKNKPLGDIDQATVARAVESRRKLPTVRSKAKNATPHYPSNSTVNRDVIETLRPVLKRARTHWKGQHERHGLPEIDWGELRLPEPQPLGRLYSARERAAWREETPESLRLALDMILTYGLRFGELLFSPAALDLDPEDPTLTLQKGRKRDVLLRLSLRHDHARELAARAARAVAAELPHLWFRQGRHGPEAYDYGEVYRRINAAAKRAGIDGGRVIHSARHHAGATILRRSKGNLKAVQLTLGHASITSSQRYAKMLTSDLRALYEDEVPRHSPEPDKDRDDESQTG